MWCVTWWSDDYSIWLKCRSSMNISPKIIYIRDKVMRWEQNNRCREIPISMAIANTILQKKEFRLVSWLRVLFLCIQYNEDIICLKYPTKQIEIQSTKTLWTNYDVYKF